MKVFKIVASILVVFVVGAILGIHSIYTTKKAKIYTPPTFSIKDDVAIANLPLGERIYKVRGGCIDCHGPDLTGVKFLDDPGIGTFYGANLTPIGISQRSDEDLARAIRYGVRPNGESLNGMPSMDFVGLSKGDLAALIAYLRSVPPTGGTPPKNKIGPLGRVLTSLDKLPLITPAAFIDQTQGFADKPLEAKTAEFGAYLTTPCRGCHGPDLRGGPIPGGDPSWPSAATLRLGSNPVWTEASFRQMIATGISLVTQAPVKMPMPMGLLKQMDDTEITAIWLFLSSLK